jgi:hypothetical protein
VSLFLLFFLNPKALAGPPQKASVVVWSRNPEAIRALFPEPNVHILDTADEDKELGDNGYVKPKARNALFRKLNLEATLADLDDLDKDLLMQSARTESVQAMRKYYPMLSADQAAKLQAAVKEITK